MATRVRCPKCGEAVQITQVGEDGVCKCNACGQRLRIGTALGLTEQPAPSSLTAVPEARSRPTFWRSHIILLSLCGVFAVIAVCATVIICGITGQRKSSIPAPIADEVISPQASEFAPQKAASPHPPAEAKVVGVVDAASSLSKSAVVLSPQELFAKASPAVVRVVVRDENYKEIALGSGFAVTQDGTYLTNYHVIKGGKFATVLLSTGATFFVDSVLAVDEHNDLAVLKVEGSGLPCLELGAAGDLPTEGMRVYAIGNPKGLTNTISDGLVSGIRRDGADATAIQTTAPISPGSSGGPLLDGQAKVIGVTTFYVVGGQNLNFAIPSSKVHGLLAKAQSAKPARLGSAGGKALDSEGTSDLADAWAAVETKNWRGAVRILQKLQKNSPNSAPVWRLAGYLHEELGNRDLAIEAYQTVVRLNPDDSLGYCDLASVYIDARLYPQAVEASKTAILLDPSDDLGYLMIGLAYGHMKRWSEAIDAYKTSLRLKPDVAASHYLLGCAFKETQLYAEAAESYKAAIRLKPDYAVAYANLCKTYCISHLYRDAAQTLASLRKLDPKLAAEMQPQVALGIAFEQCLDGLDKEFGAKYRDDAIRMAINRFLDRGYSADNPPGWRLEKAALRVAYMVLAKADNALPFALPRKPTEGSQPAERMLWIQFRGEVRRLVSNKIVDGAFVQNSTSWIAGLDLSVEEAELLAISPGDVMQ